MGDLAVLGGVPEFDRPRLVGVPNIGDRRTFDALLDDALARRWLSNGGPLVRRFEARVAAQAGVRHCVATCNATAALELLIRAAGLTGEVIVPAFTFPATVHAIRWMGLQPVLCDVEPDTGNIDPARVPELITPRTSGIVGVHLWGRPCRVDELEALADRHGLTLILDAAQAFGARYRDRPVGGRGAAEVFSFHATKLVNTFEGGAVVTDDGSLAARLRAMHNFGIVDEDEVALTGTNAKMSEASAAMGLASLDRVDGWVARNWRRHRAYRSGLDGIDGITLLGPAEWSRPAYHHAVLRVDAGRAGLTRDQLMAVLRAENVLTRRYFYPGCHRMAPYFDDRRAYPHADALATSLLSLPTGAGVDTGDVRRITDLIRVAVGHGPALAAELDGSPVPADDEVTEGGQPRGSHA